LAVRSVDPKAGPPYNFIYQLRLATIQVSQACAVRHQAASESIFTHSVNSGQVLAHFQASKFNAVIDE
jgi:hypothetical protein